MKEMLVQLGKRAKDAEAALRTISTDKKNQVLAAVADPGKKFRGSFKGQ